MTDVFAFIGEHVTLAIDGTPVALERGAYQAYPGATFVRLELSRPLERAPADLALAADAAFFERFGSQHVNLVKVAGGGDQIQQAALTGGSIPARRSSWATDRSWRSARHSSSWASRTSSSGTTTSCSSSP